MRIRHCCFVLDSTILVACAALAGCGTAGTDAMLAPGRVSTGTQSPHSSQIVDADKAGIATGAGPTAVTLATPGSLNQIEAGVPSRKVIFQRPDGTALMVSSPSDLAAEAVTFDAATGSLSIGKFGTSVSAPITALQPATVEFIKANRDVLIEQVKAATTISESAKGALIEIIAKIATGGAL